MKSNGSIGMSLLELSRAERDHLSISTMQPHNSGSSFEYLCTEAVAIANLAAIEMASSRSLN